MDKQRQKYKGLLDMIDGGGAGAVGNEFEGGGLLSLLGNLLFDPYGSDDEDRMASRNQFYNAQGGAVAPPSLLAPESGVKASLRPPALPQSMAERNMGLDPFGGAGPNVSGAAAERGMGLDPFGGAGPNVSAPFNPANAAPVQPSAPGYTQHSSMKTPTNYGNGSGMTPSNNYVPSSMPDTNAPVQYDQGSGMTPSSNYPDPRQRFANQLVEMVGADTAENLMRSGMGEQAYQAFVANGYNMPNY